VDAALQLRSWIGGLEKMLMVWFLVTLVGVSLVLSLLDRPPIAVSVPLFESEREDDVAFRCLEDPDGSGREISAGGGTP